MKRIRFGLSILAIALVISLVVSLLSLTDLLSPPAKADPEPCTNYLYTTYCNTGSCVPSDPDGCGPGQWSYYCARNYLLVYANGQKVGSSASSGYYCNTTRTCYSTCD